METNCFFGYNILVLITLTLYTHPLLLQTLLRQDDTNGGLSEALAAEMRYMQSENPTIEADSYTARRK